MQRLRKYLYAIFFVALVVLILSSVATINVRREEFIKKLDKEVEEIKKSKNEPLNEEFDDNLEIPSVKSENVIEKEHKYEPIGVVEPEPIVQEVLDSYITRMTSFYANDGYGTGSCTGSGLCEWDFQVNEHGWYTYQGKLVVATATVYLANQGWQVNQDVHLYRYGDELTLVIDGVEYDAIVKDSCGNCMHTNRVDLFVSNVQSVKDTMIEVRRK